MNYIGIDHHMQYSRVTLMNKYCASLTSDKVANLRRKLKRGEFTSDDKISLLSFCS